MRPTLEAIVPVELDGSRIDLAIAVLFPSTSRTQAQHLLEAGHVAIDGALVTRPSTRARPGSHIRVAFPEPGPSRVAPESLAIAVVYEDRDVAVVDKPAGMVVHPAPGHSSGTLVNAALYRFVELPSPSGIARSGIVHRLDKGTSGLLVVAKTETALLDLQRQFKTRQVDKAYLALVRGHPPPAGVVDGPIGRDPRHRKRMAIVHNGKAAL